jgi:hypothetical protein
LAVGEGNSYSNFTGVSSTTYIRLSNQDTAQFLAGWHAAVSNAKYFAVKLGA